MYYTFSKHVYTTIKAQCVVDHLARVLKYVLLSFVIFNVIHFGYTSFQLDNNICSSHSVLGTCILAFICSCRSVEEVYIPHVYGRDSNNFLYGVY